MTRLRSRRFRTEEPPANPMDGLGNLADAMLVLAVGILLALVLNWKLDLTVSAPAEDQEPPVAIEEEDLQSTNAEALDEEALQRVGALYYDAETNTYYAITEGN